MRQMRLVLFPVTSPFTPSPREAGDHVCEDPACTAGRGSASSLASRTLAGAAAGRHFQEALLWTQRRAHFPSILLFSPSPERRVVADMLSHPEVA